MTSTGQLHPRAFADRTEAAQELRRPLERLELRRVLLLATDRHSMVLAHHLAEHLHADREYLPVELVYLTDDTHPWTAVGAVTGREQRQVDVDALTHFRLAPGQLDAAVADAERRLRQSDLVTDTNSSVTGRDIVLVHDGTDSLQPLAWAARSLRSRQPGRIILAIALAPDEAVAGLGRLADEVVCARSAAWYPWYQLHGRLYQHDDQHDEQHDGPHDEDR